MHLPVQMDWMAVSSYGSGTRSSGVVRILKDLDTDITGRHVLIVEDIVDSGLTLSWLAGNLRSRGPASLAVCAMLRKPGSAQMQVDVRYTGFDIGDEFVVGYGLDYAQRYRNLPFIGTLAAPSGVPSSFVRMAIPPEVDGSVRLVRRERPRADGAAHQWS
jgi:hypoxanthine phosphoribosyltransferase